MSKNMPISKYEANKDDGYRSRSPKMKVRMKAIVIYLGKILDHGASRGLRWLRCLV